MMDAAIVGVPLAEGVYVGDRSRVDAVPLIDAATASILGATNSFMVVRE